MNNAKELLHTAGLRATPGRLALIDFLQSQHEPVGTPELTKRFVPKTMDTATLYRTLEAFEENGLVRTASIDRNYASYEWNQDREHHHHLVCIVCKKIEDIPDCDLEAISKTLIKNSKQFDSISSHSLEFFGICKTCSKK
ncbi:MAG: Fur family transcriptional regulator [Patescibacteria group bacterium]